jgi:hypothetical protein
VNRFAIKVLVGVLLALFIASAVYQAVAAWHDRQLGRLDDESPQYRRMVDTAP